MTQATEALFDEGEAPGGRLALLHPDRLDAQQRCVYEYLLSQKVGWAERAVFQARLIDGRLIGPFDVFLQPPMMSRAYNAWNDSETD